MKRWKKELAGFLCFLVVLGAFCFGASSVLIPKRYDYGATWSMYQQEEEDTVDVMFFGSSLAYCDVIPSVIYEESGVTSYVMAGPEQTMPVTYRYVKQACKTQSPKVVFIEATGMLYFQHNRSTKINITYMPWSLDRLALTFQVAEPEERLGLLFPLESYHSRWNEITLDEVEEGLFGYGPDLLAGYTFLKEVLPITQFTQRDMGDYPEAYAENLEAAEEIVDLCEEQGIRVVFFVVPNSNPPETEDLARIEEDLTALGGEFWIATRSTISFLSTRTRTFLTPSTLTTGVRRSTPRYLGQWLVDQGLPATQGEDEALWQQRVEHFHALRDEADSQPIQLSGAAAE